jgi:hypothetical protein
LTEAGTRIDFSDEQLEKADDSMRRSFDRDPKVSEDSNSHPEKHSWHIISTEEGIRIDDNDEQ